MKLGIHAEPLVLPNSSNRSKILDIETSEAFPPFEAEDLCQFRLTIDF